MTSHDASQNVSVQVFTLGSPNLLLEIAALKPLQKDLEASIC